MIKLENDRLVFSFPEVHDEAHCGIEFQRTLRIPDDGKDYRLPPGLGCFPLRHLDDDALRRTMGHAAAERVLARHGLDAASRTLDTALGRLSR